MRPRRRSSRSWRAPPPHPADLSVSNEGTAGGTFGGPQGAFMVNWTYIWTNYDATQPEVKDDLGFTRYPQSTQGEESRPPYGGIGVGVSAYSEHVDEAMAGDRVHHLARQPGRERRAHRQHAGQLGRLRLPGAGRDLPAAAARPVPGEPRRGGSTHGHAVLERHLRRAPELVAPDRTASTTRPRRTRSSSSRTCCTEGACCEHRDRHRAGRRRARRRRRPRSAATGRGPRTGSGSAWWRRP